MVYDFEYMQQDFPCSASVLLLSSDSRSMFKNCIQVPAKVINESAYMTEQKFSQILSDQELMQQLRKYFLLLTHFSDLTLQNYGVTQECSQYAQQYFVQRRKEEAEFVEAQEA